MIYSEKYGKRIFAAVLAVVLAVSGASLLAGCDSSGEVNPFYPVVISEVMSSNSAFAPAADGNYYDWVELYNSSKEAVDLSDCYITDTEEVPLKYRLSGLVVEAGGYAVIYLSDKDGVDEAGAHHANFRLSSLGELLMLSDKYGKVITQLQVPALHKNVSYGLVTGSLSEYAIFASPSAGYENGGEYVSNIDELINAGCPVVINEYMSDNTYIHYDAESDYGDWIELYNTSSESYDLTGASLTDDEGSIGKWSFPQGAVIGAGEYMLVWCDGKNKLDSRGEYHTNFSIGSRDSVLALYTNLGLLAASIETVDLPSNVSCGYPVGSSELKLFSRPTPGRANDSSAYDLSADLTPEINNGLLISEVLSVSWFSGAYKKDYIELYNSTSSAVSLGGYTISQTPGEVVFTFPDMKLGSGNYLLVWCDGTTGTNMGDLHCPIKLNQGGESIYLAESSGRICDYFETGKTSYGVSSGRVGSDCAMRYLFRTPTPGAENSDPSAEGYSPMPVISLRGGYVEAGTAVEINAPEDCTIYYTTNGSDPTRGSKQYGSPITIYGTTVLKAAAYCPGGLLSQVACETYLVEEKHDIPVVSLSGNYDDILGEEGFYTRFKSGAEVKVHIEYFDASGIKAVEFDAGAGIFGQYSRTLDQKGIKLKLKERYGENEVNYPFFKDSASGVASFGSLLLRPSGQDYNRAKLRDELVPAIIRGQMDIDYQEFQAVALYIDSEYYGLYYLRERLDAEYLEHKYLFAEGSFDLVKSQLYIQAGSMDEYVALETFAREHDLTKEENYEYMCSQVDIDSLMNFWIVETYFSNTDTGNIRCYKAKDGKWRWMLYDFDWSMTASTWKKNFIKSYCLGKAHGTNKHMSNVIVRKMLANEEFKDRFISLYCYHLNTTFAPKRTIEILNSMAAVIENEIPRQAARWGVPKPANWRKQVEFLTNILNEKPDMIQEQLMEAFGLSRAEMNRYMRQNTEYPSLED